MTGRERRILDKQFFKNEEEMMHPRPIDYNAADLKDYYASKRQMIDLGEKKTKKVRKHQEPH